LVLHLFDRRRREECFRACHDGNADGVDPYSRVVDEHSQTPELEELSAIEEVIWKLDEEDRHLEEGSNGRSRDDRYQGSWEKAQLFWMEAVPKDESANCDQADQGGEVMRAVSS